MIDSKLQVVLDTVAVGQNNEADLLPGLLDTLPETLKAASIEPGKLGEVTLLADTAYHTVENLLRVIHKGYRCGDPRQ